MPLVIAKTVLPDASRFYLAVGRIFGIGRAQGLAIAEEIGISKEARVADLKAHHVQQVREKTTAVAVVESGWSHVQRAIAGNSTRRRGQHIEVRVRLQQNIGSSNMAAGT
jgi:ribosomal protein S13